MKFIAVAVVIVVLATVGAVHSSVIPLSLATGNLVLPPLSYTAQTVDINGLQVGTVVAGQPARLVSVGPTLLAGGQTLVTSAGTVQLAGAPAALQLAPAAIQVAGLPAALQLATGLPAAVQVAPAVQLVQAEGNYVAATRGAVHTAPLPGHSQSASSINLEPAPGTL